MRNCEGLNQNPILLKGFFLSRYVYSTVFETSKSITRIEKFKVRLKSLTFLFFFVM